ncbi:hypothetical protein [Nitrosopumilus sp.]|uniref:hypothetical protein n=1 Tax=Nitrosopumilus sp. TaxID=2024843 RepID=UPI0034A0A1E1
MDVRTCPKCERKVVDKLTCGHCGNTSSSSHDYIKKVPLQNVFKVDDQGNPLNDECDFIQPDDESENLFLDDNEDNVDEPDTDEYNV